MKPTSISAHQKLKKAKKDVTLNKLVLDVISVADPVKGVTGAEIHACLKRLGHDHQLDSVRPRMANLFEKNKVHVVATRKCNITGESVQAWAMGPGLAVLKKPGFRLLYMSACKRIEELEAKIKTLEGRNVTSPE